MIIPLEHKGQYHGVIQSTAWRGCACYLSGRSATTGQLEFKVPAIDSSAQSAKACYLVDWVDNYTVVTGGSTSSARDYTTGNRNAVFYYDGMFRTNIFRVSGTLARYHTRTTDTAYYTVFGADLTNLHVHNDTAAYQGWLTSTCLNSNFAATVQAHNNCNFQLISIDNASAGPYGRDLWVTVKSIKGRVDAGYVRSTASTYRVDY